jgi:hypothetical protein
MRDVYPVNATSSFSKEEVLFLKGKSLMIFLRKDLPNRKYQLL